MNIKTTLQRTLLALAASACLPAAALNILLTNDDGYQHPNIRALYRELKSAGHQVRIAAPWADQSAKGGAFIYGVEVQVGRDTDPAYPDSHYVKTFQHGLCVSAACAGQQVQLAVSGTPVMAAIYGLEKVLPEAELVIAGPNPGNNLGYINHNSGTFNAALFALHRGVPAIAVSADLKEKDPARVAAVVGQLVRQLQARHSPGQPLLPKGLGLSVNLPDSTKFRGVRLTEIGSYVPFDVTYVDDLGVLSAEQKGRFGVAFKYAAPPRPEDADSEAIWVGQGYVSISPFGTAPGGPAPSGRQLLNLNLTLDRLTSP